MPARRSAVLALVLAATGALVVLPSAMATRHRTTVVKAAHNAHLNKQIVVDARSMTLYRLKPETPRHLLCASQRCLAVWKPLTVRSSSTSAIKAGPGVTGRLGLLRRGRNSYQVTLRGMPLYRYTGDSSRGDANGENIASFGGTWHAVPASTTTRTTPPTMPAPTPTPTYPPY
jgi:predicted lipoprotein with Yx(FWY)xxD motif